MTRTTVLAATLLAVLMSASVPPAAFADERKCHLEQQCKWVNFKKVCTWVKVCS